MSRFFDEVQEVFREVFADDQLVITRDATAADVEGWDSIANINLLVALEKAFDVRLTTAEMALLTQEGQTVGDLADLLETKRGASG